MQPADIYLYTVSWPRSSRGTFFQLSFPVLCISPEFERSICSINQYLRPYSELCFSLSGGNLGLLLRLSSGNCVIASYLALTHGYVCWRRAYPHKPCFSLAGGNLPRSSESLMRDKWNLLIMNWLTFYTTLPLRPPKTTTTKRSKFGENSTD